MRIVDLSQLLYPGMPVYPGDGAFSATPRYVFEKDGCNVLDLAMGAPPGTHLDVPRHFVADGATLDMLPLDRFCGTARIASSAARQMWGGVGKSGSPTERSMTSMPDAAIADARAAIASVADGSRARMRRAVARLFDSMAAGTLRCGFPWKEGWRRGGTRRIAVA